MADRIFPNTYQEEPLDSDLVFKGIDWDNFNTKLAEVQSNPQSNELPEEYREVIAGKMPAEVLEKFKEKAEKNKPSEKDRKNLDDVPKQLRKHVKQTQSSEEYDEEEDEKVTEEHDESSSKKKNVKANTIVFNHPSQLSAEAVEAAIQDGNQELANAILAARHERRVRLANKIETRVAQEADRNLKLAQRKAYRESLVKKAAESTKQTRVASKPADDFVKVSSLDNSAKKAFASKALSQGFPQEYVDAILGESKPVVDNTVEIRNVMSSELSENIKKSAVSSMVKVATLSDADYSRLVDYWKNELGYGDQEWIDALFTKKYDK
jgi:hypothetical protein